MPTDQSRPRCGVPDASPRQQAVALLPPCRMYELPAMQPTDFGWHITEVFRAAQSQLS